MAKKVTKTTPIIKQDSELQPTKLDILTLSKELGCTYESLYDIQAWLRNKFNIHAEIFYSLFHKKWAINNYFVDTIKGNRITWDYKGVFYQEYDDALIVALYNILKLCK